MGAYVYGNKHLRLCPGKGRRVGRYQSTKPHGVRPKVPNFNIRYSENFKSRYHILFNLVIICIIYVAGFILLLLLLLLYYLWLYTYTHTRMYRNLIELHEALPLVHTSLLPVVYVFCPAVPSWSVFLSCIPFALLHLYWLYNAPFHC